MLKNFLKIGIILKKISKILAKPFEKFYNNSSNDFVKKLKS
jgi:hypothetical protein